MAYERPRSAVRPRSARMGARPAAADPSQHPDWSTGATGGDDDCWWLFYTAYRLTTTDIALAGFTNASLLDASRWRGSAEQSAAEVAAAELAYTFGFPPHLKFPAVDDAHQDALVQALRNSFTNRGGDLLVIFQNTVVLDDTTQTRVDPTSGLEEGLNVIARCVDAINRAYAAAEQAGDANLAGVSVVLEGFGRSGLPNLTGAWSSAQRISFDVQPFTDALPT